MKIKTSELTGPALDWAVAKCLGQPDEWMADHKRGYINSPSTDWSQGGPIIERIKPQLTYQTSGKHAGQWGCNIWHTNKQGALCPGTQYGPTPLIAAMRCYVASKLGDEIDIPEELQ